MSAWFLDSELVIYLKLLSNPTFSLTLTLYPVQPIVNPGATYS